MAAEARAEDVVSTTLLTSMAAAAVAEKALRPLAVVSSGAIVRQAMLRLRQYLGTTPFALYSIIVAF